MKKSTIIGLFCSTLYFGVQAQDASDLETIYFEKNSYELTDQAKENLQELKTHIKKTRNRKEIKITGHTDVDASNGYNKKLALNRALAVQQFLESEEVYNRCHLFSKGEEQTVNANSSETEKALNRRVVVEMNYSPQNLVYRDFLKKYQEYEISVEKDTVLKCTEGSELVIQKGDFSCNPKNGPITVKVKEFYDKGSFIASNISASTYDNKILESRGMLNISVSQKGKPLKINKGEKIEVLFKDRKEGDGTQLFTGIRSNGELVWRVSSKSKQSESGSNPLAVRQHTTWYKDGSIIKRVVWNGSFNTGQRGKIISINEGEELAVDTFAASSADVMAYNMMAITKLGWINCDRFYNNPAEKIDYVVNVPGEMDADVTLVFEDINSVMPFTYRKGNEYVFSNIPVGMKVKVIGLYKKEDQSEYFLAALPTTTQKNNTKQLLLKKGTKEDVKNLMAGL